MHLAAHAFFVYLCSPFFHLFAYVHHASSVFLPCRAETSTRLQRNWGFLFLLPACTLLPCTVANDPHSPHLISHGVQSSLSCSTLWKEKGVVCFSVHPTLFLAHWSYVLVCTASGISRGKMAKETCTPFMQLWLRQKERKRTHYPPVAVWQHKLEGIDTLEANVECPDFRALPALGRLFRDGTCPKKRDMIIQTSNLWCARLDGKKPRGEGRLT